MTSPSGAEPSQIGFCVEGTIFFSVDLNRFTFVWRLSLIIQNMDQQNPLSQLSFILIIQTRFSSVALAFNIQSLWLSSFLEGSL